MTMQIIGTGVGRTGTYSLKLAINQLGLGPCHHLEEVLKEGWGPLCAFLEAPVPDGPFPRTNDRAEFWDLVSGKA